MNFLTMQQELSDRVKAYDETISADATDLKRWLNMGKDFICGYDNWPFMYYHEIIQTVVDITTGTVAIPVASTTVTFSSAPTVSCTDRFIRFGDDSNWYKITSHTASASTATISPAYYGTSDLTAETYKVRKLFYATATPMDSILDIKKMAPGRFLESANARDTDVFLPLYWDQGAVYKYISSIPDSTGGVRFSLLYSPSDVENLQVRGIKTMADMSSDSDSPIWPSRWHDACVDFAAHYAFVGLDDSRAKMEFERGEMKLKLMQNLYAPDLGRHRISRSLNTGILEGPAYVLPPQYGVNQG